MQEKSNGFNKYLLCVHNRVYKIRRLRLLRTRIFSVFSLSSCPSTVLSISAFLLSLASQCHSIPAVFPGTKAVLKVARKEQVIA
jgi:hypothetical protein